MVCQESLSPTCNGRECDHNALQNGNDGHDKCMILICGKPGAGKTSLTQAIKDNHMSEIGAYSVGKAIKAKMYKENIEIREETIGKFASSLREKHGLAASAIILAEHIDRSQDVIVVDGIRSTAEVNYFKEEFNRDVKVIEVVAPMSHRLYRILKRGRDDDIDSREELMQRERRELKWNEFFEISDHTYICRKIINDVNISDKNDRMIFLYSQVKDIIGERC